MQRKLRIAASAFFGLLAVVFAALWGRSYVRCDHVRLFISYFDVDCGCVKGKFGCEVMDWNRWPTPPFYATFDSRPIQEHEHLTELSNFAGFVFDSDRNFFFPFWLPTGLSLFLSAFCMQPKWKTRFSLRTLLLTTTLVAIALGLTS